MSYDTFIKDVFLTPIRSVLVVDDEYPTLDKLLSGHVEGKNSPDFKDGSRLSTLLGFCRSQQPQWLVDVHDGIGNDTESLPLSSIKQCDLLILDFLLDGESSNGDKSIEIVRQLASSDNFNLVIIYTSSEPEDVFSKILVALEDGVKSRLGINNKNRTDVENRIEKLEDDDPDVKIHISALIGYKECVAVARNGPGIRNPANSEIFSPFVRKLEELDVPKKMHQGFLNFFIAEFLEKVRSVDRQQFDVTFSSEGTLNHWILAGNVFLTVVKKETPADRLLDQLASSLNNWAPSPNRLVFGKLKAALEASGLRVEHQLLNDIPLQSLWLKDILETDETERPLTIGTLIDKQTETLTDILRDDVTDFGKNVFNCLLSEYDSPEAVVQEFWGLTSDRRAAKTALISHNTYVSTKPPSGNHLVPGHVIFLSETDEYWLCVSPACDLVAGRKDSGRDFKKRIYPWMPFFGIKLHRVKDDTALSEATRGAMLFLKVRNEFRQFSYFPEGNSERNPIWEEMVAANEGRLCELKEFKLCKVEKKSADHHPPKFTRFDASIVSQLRSEYVATHSSRLNNHLSRIGLDFKSPPEGEEE